jgi:hypothetical protein
VPAISPGGGDYSQAMSAMPNQVCKHQTERRRDYNSHTKPYHTFSWGIEIYRLRLAGLQNH